jgi:hypothetical protein
MSSPVWGRLGSARSKTSTTAVARADPAGFLHFPGAPLICPAFPIERGDECRDHAQTSDFPSVAGNAVTLSLIGGSHSGVRRDSADAIVSAGSSRTGDFPAMKIGKCSDDGARRRDAVPAKPRSRDRSRIQVTAYVGVSALFRTVSAWPMSFIAPPQTTPKWCRAPRSAASCVRGCAPSPRRPTSLPGRRNAAATGAAPRF